MNGFYNGKRLILLIAVFVLTGLAFTYLTAAENSAEHFKKAEKYFLEKSFQKAQDEYKLAIENADATFSKVNFSKYRIAQCQFQLHQYTQAIQTFDELVKTMPKNSLKIDVYRAYAQMRIQMPYYYYKKGDEVSWGKYISGGRYHYVLDDNQKLALSYIETALDLQKTLLIDSSSTLANEERTIWRERYATLHLELAGILELRDNRDYKWDNREYWQRENPEDPDGPNQVSIDAKKPDGEGWSKVQHSTFRIRPYLDRIMDLYKNGHDRFKALADEFEEWYKSESTKAEDNKELRDKIAGRQAGFQERAGEALYRRAAYLSQNDESSPETLLIVHGAKNWQKYYPLTYIDEFVEAYPDHYRAPEVLFLKASEQNSTERYVEAVETCNILIDKYMETPWAKSAKTFKEEILRPRLNVYSSLNSMPGENASFEVNVRNIKELHVELYKFDIKRYIEESGYLSSVEKNLNSIYSMLDRITDKDKYEKQTRTQANVQDFAGLMHYLTKVNATGHKTKDIDKHRYHSETIMTGASERGTYVVKVTGEKMFGANIVHIASKTLVNRPFSDRKLFILSDRKTGEPVMGKNELIIKEYRYKPHTSYVKVYRQNIHEESANYWHIYRDLPPQHSISSVTSIVFCEDGEVVFHTGQRGQWWWNRQFRDAEINGYTITDRPIYRPEQKINFTSILRHRKPGRFGYAPVQAGAKVMLTMFDSKNTKLIDQEYELDEFGAIHGSYTLGEEPALGSYRIYMRWKSGSYIRFNSSSHYFSVEEYRKPEYEVNVSTDQPVMKVGSEVTAKVEGKYYFGAPVSNGEISYKVYRSEYIHTYRFPSSWDWLYGYMNMWADRWSDHWGRYAGWQRELVTEGKGRLDDLGNFEIKFDAGPRTLANGPDDPAVKQLLIDDPNLKRFFEKDYKYDVQVEVTDSSRRVIEGSGQIKVTRQSFSMFSNYRYNFYRPGSKVEVELRSITPSGNAVAVEGNMLIEKVERYWWANPEGRREIKEDVLETIGTMPFETDENGVVFIKRVFDKAGLYRLTFTAPDPEGGVVKHVNRLLIVAEDNSGAGLRFDTLEIVPQKRFFMEGEEIEFAILGGDEEMTIHTMLEPGDGGVMPDKYKMIKIKGSAGVLKFQAVADFVPNVFLTAVSVKENRVHQASVEVFVPPVKEFLDVTIIPNKEEYSPGEEGTVKIIAKDSEGNPVEGQFSLSVADEAVYAIQEDNKADIRQHFYGKRRYLTFRVEHSQNQYFYGAVQDMNEFGSRFWWGMPERGSMYSKGWFQRDYLTAKELEEIQSGKSTLDKLKGKLVEKYRSEASESDKDSNAPSKSKSNWGMEDSLQGGSAGGFGGKEMSRGRRGLADKKAEAPGAPMENLSKNSEAIEEEYEGAPEFMDEEIAEDQTAEAKERKDFKDTAFYSSQVRTDKNGEAIVKFKYPDNLTTFRITVRGATKDSKVGQAVAMTMVTKNIIVRLAAPRFFMERDELVVSTIVHNKFATEEKVKVILEVPTILSDSEDLPAVADTRLKYEKEVVVPAKGEMRQDWHLKVHGDGIVKITASALSARESDMMTMVFPAYRHGIEKYMTYAGAMSGDAEKVLNMEMPEDFDPDKTWVRIGMTPTVATACIDSIPYLIDYPYGCIEQTMSRFMPAVVVRGTLKDMGISLEDVQARRALISTDKWDRGSINMFINNPVFDEQVLNNVINSSLARIASWQNGDGGWGWFKGFSSSPYMTAYVIHGLTLAKQNGIKVDENMLSRGVSFLGKSFLQERNLHRASFMAYAMAPYYDTTAFGSTEQYERYMDKLMERRADFNQLSRAYFALALHITGKVDDAKLLIENIEDYAKYDEQSGTAYWKTSSDGWWYWWNNALETNTAVLRALAAIKPDHKLIEPLSRWVINHRQGNRWESTKGSAMAILSLMDYAKQRGELDADYELEIYYGDKLYEKIHVTKENLLTMKPSFMIHSSDVEAGKGVVRIVKRGKGSFAWTATLKTYDMSVPIKKAGYEIFVERKYYKLTEKIENPEATDGSRRITWEKTELKDLDEVKSGDLIEVLLEIDAKNDYQYVMFNDMKPAGCEAVSKKSGYSWRDGLGVFMEFRDERVSMFASWVPQGKHTLTYRLRAEVPGKFHALPTVVEAMYAPLVRANSDEWRVNIHDKE